MTLKLLTHRATAYFQAYLSILFIVGYFYVFQTFLFGKVKIPGEFHDTMQTLLGVLTGSVTTILNFWFSRQRLSEPSAPGTTP